MDQVIGQDRAVGQLQSALSGDRVHHAYVFHGPAGVGKFTTAVAFAKILLCHSPQRDLAGRIEACGVCESCRLMAKVNQGDETATGAHPDFHPITKELARYSDDAQVRARKLMTIPLDLLRQTLIGPVYRAAQLRHGKVFIVDEAELIDDRGQNLLLKTLEEPPAGTVVILVTASLHRLLMTLRSRCQRVAFTPLPDAIVEKWIDHRWPQLGEEDRRWLGQFAAGSLGRVVLAGDYNLAAWSRTILPAVDQIAQGRFPVGLGAQISESIDGFALAWVERHENASKEAANKQGARLMWSMIAQHALRRLAEAVSRCKPGDPEAAQAAAAPWLGVVDALVRAESELAANVQLSLVADHAVAGMLAAAAGVPPAELAAW